MAPLNVHPPASRNSRGGLDRRSAKLRIAEVGDVYLTELVEAPALTQAQLEVVVIPGNPGISPFYADYVSGLHSALDGRANVTAISHLGFTEKNWERGRLFSLDQQLEHKLQYVLEIAKKSEIPVVLVGHSIGAYIALELLRKCPSKVRHVIGLYPFLKVNTKSWRQQFLKRATRTWPLGFMLSATAAAIGALPKSWKLALTGNLLGKEWDASAIEIGTRYLLQYSVVRNFCYMGKTEFEQLGKDLDWEFLRAVSPRISFVFGNDDHWGPLHHRDEITKVVPELETVVEREGHLHAFCCTQEGSTWAAEQTARMIRGRFDLSAE